MRAACRRRVASALTISLLAMTLVAACRPSFRRSAPVGEARPAPVAPATQDPLKYGDADSRIRGRIVDELGAPPPATVYVLLREAEADEEGPVVDAATIVTTDAGGEFAYDRTTAASNALRIEVAGLAPRRLWLPVDTPRTPILMLGTRTIEGVVRDTEGRPAAGAVVDVVVYPEKGARDYEVTSHHLRERTRGDGSYRFDRLPAGRFHVRAEGTTPEGQAWREDARATIAEAASGARVDLGTPFRQPRVTVRVRAAPGGDPQKGLLLIFLSASGRRRVAAQSADGTHVVRLHPDSWRAVMSVSVEKDGVYREGEAALHDSEGRPATFTIRQGDPDPTIDLYLPGT